MTGLAKPCMSIHPMASPTFCLVSIEVSSLTVTSDCSCLVIILFFSGHAIGIANLKTTSHSATKLHSYMDPYPTHAARVLVLIRITVLDLEPDPCFQIFPNISETNYRIFNCNISNRRSGQELPFIFELRAPTCL